MEASTLIHTGHAGLRSPAPLLRLHGDEKLVALTRKGNAQAYEALVARYQSRLLSFCRHMLGSREDAEDVLQEVFAAAFNAMLADERPINVRPWLYRIARNRCLNHLRRAQAVGMDSMDVHFAENGTTTAEKVHDREEFRLLIADVQRLPETQRTALLLREIDALSYEQIAEAMETTVPGIKSLLVRARVSLAEAAEARLLSCDDVRLELGEVAEGLKRTSPPVRRHLRTCERCATFKKQLNETNKALAAMFPVGPLLLFKKFVLTHASATAGAGGATATAGATVASSAAAGSALSTGLSALATKAAAGLAAAAIVTAGAVEVNQPRRHTRPAEQAAVVAPAAAAPAPVVVQPPSRTAPAAEPKPKARAAHHTESKPAAAPTAPDQPTQAPPAATAPADAQQPAATAPQREYDSTTLPQPSSSGATTGGAMAPEEQPGPAVTVETSAPAPAPAPAAPAPADPAQAPPAPPADQQPTQDPAAAPAPPAPAPAPDVVPAAGTVPPPAP